MTAKQKLEEKMKVYGIKKLETTSKINEYVFAYSPGISKPYVNQVKREEHRRSMSLGVR